VIYGSGRFCGKKCARAFATSKNRDEINKKVSTTLKGKPSPFKGIKRKIATPKVPTCDPEYQLTISIPKAVGKTVTEKFFVSLINKGVLGVDIQGRCFNNKTKRKIGAIGSGRYPKITMSGGQNEIKHFQIHKLVWMTYVGDIPDGLEVNHKDLNKSNPSLDNLELITHKENMRHAYENGVMHTFEKRNTTHLKRKSYGNRYHKNIPKL
jgi:hypothetical protein